MDAPPPYQSISNEKRDHVPLAGNAETETPIIVTSQPTAPNVVIVPREYQMSHQYVPELCSTGAPGYCTWCWFGLLCQLPASYFLGKRLGEKRVFLKYGIAGMLKRYSHRNSTSQAICMVLFSCYAYYQMYLLIEGILNLDFNDFNDQACNVFCTRSISITIVPLLLFGFLLYQRRFFIRVAKKPESCCCSCLTIMMCHCLSYGQIGAYTEEHPIMA